MKSTRQLTWGKPFSILSVKSIFRKTQLRSKKTLAVIGSLGVDFEHKRELIMYDIMQIAPISSSLKYTGPLSLSYDIMHCQSGRHCQSIIEMSTERVKSKY